VDLCRVCLVSGIVPGTSQIREAFRLLVTSDLETDEVLLGRVGTIRVEPSVTRIRL